MDHAAVGQRLDQPVGQGGFAPIGDPAQSGGDRGRIALETGLGVTGSPGGTDSAGGGEA